MKKLIIEKYNEQMADLEKNRKENCVICFELVDEDEENFKFNCCHKKFMHYNCIQNIASCPVCRDQGTIPTDNLVIIHEGYNKEVICLFATIVLVVILIIIPAIIFELQFGDYENQFNYTKYNNSLT